MASLRAQGITLSAETVRRRLMALEPHVAFQPLPNLSALGLSAAMLLVRVRGGTQDHDAVLKRLRDLHAYHVIEAVGRFDLAALLPVHGPRDLAAAISSLRGMEAVEDVEHLLVTRSESSLERLLALLASGPQPHRPARGRR